MSLTHDQLCKKYLDSCLNGDLDTVIYMTKKERKSLKNYGMLNNCTIKACDGGHYEIFEALVDYKDTTDSDVFFHAFGGGNNKIISKLIDIFTNNVCRTKPSLNDNLWNNALLCACVCGKLEIFKLYMNRTIWTVDLYVHCFYEACGSGNIELVYYILDHYERSTKSKWNWIKFNENYYGGRNGFEMACSSGCMEIINLFIRT